MKKVICDHAGVSARCADLGNGVACVHSLPHKERNFCIPWTCDQTEPDVLVRCVEAPDE